MYRHARNTMLTLPVDYSMSKDDVKAWQHNWTQSIREVSKAAAQQRWATLKNF